MLILGAKVIIKTEINKRNQTFFLLRKKASSAYCTFAPRMMKQGSLAQLDQSTTLRTSGSGVRISHESPTLLYGVTVSTSDSGSEGGGSNPSGATTKGTLADLVYAED